MFHSVVPCVLVCSVVTLVLLTQFQFDPTEAARIVPRQAGPSGHASATPPPQTLTQSPPPVHITAPAPPAHIVHHVPQHFRCNDSLLSLNLSGAINATFEVYDRPYLILTENYPYSYPPGRLYTWYLYSKHPHRCVHLVFENVQLNDVAGDEFILVLEAKKGMSRRREPGAENGRPLTHDDLKKMRIHTCVAKAHKEDEIRLHGRQEDIFIVFHSSSMLEHGTKTHFKWEARFYVSDPPEGLSDSIQVYILLITYLMLFAVGIVISALPSR